SSRLHVRDFPSTPQPHHTPSATPVRQSHQSSSHLTPLLSSSADSLLPPGRLRRPLVAVGTIISPTPYRPTAIALLVSHHSFSHLCDYASPLSSLRPPAPAS
ncbi:hypothetical protein HAX54_004336, partial [Datura stramonium]|nr:hypothetical protein [Datura stramonium]